MAVFLQLLKETGARRGEIWQLKWADVDFESKVVNITPEKNSNPRVARLSSKLLEMLEHLPKNYGERVFSFPHMRIDNYAVNFQRQRRRTANKIQNQRLLKIHFHTFRYWKGTMLYHKTKDMYYVMQALGHKNIKNTFLYVQLDEALFQGEVDYISKVAKTEKDIWFYGESKVYFVKGKVLRWEESSDNPLKVRITLNTETSETRYFEKGASKDEVLAAQGAPDRDAGSVWDYGVSRVYFDKDRVTGWHEAPLNPLRVRH